MQRIYKIISICFVLILIPISSFAFQEEGSITASITSYGRILYVEQIKLFDKNKNIITQKINSKEIDKIFIKKGNRYEGILSLEKVDLSKDNNLIILLPNPLSEKEVSIECFGSKNEIDCGKKLFVHEKHGLITGINILLPKYYKNDFSLKIILPKESISELSVIDNILIFVGTYLSSVIVFIVSLILSIVWVLRYIKNHLKKDIIKSDNIPNIPFILSLFISNNGHLTNRDIISYIINLGLRGYIEINIDRSGKLGNISIGEDSYSLILKKNIQDVDVFDLYILKEIFKEGNRMIGSEVNFREIRIREIKKDLANKLEEYSISSGYFEENLKSSKFKYHLRHSKIISIGIFIVFCVFMLQYMYSISIVNIENLIPTYHSLIFVFLVYILFMFTYPRRTKLGFDITHKILGIKRYIQEQKTLRQDDFNNLLPFGIHFYLSGAFINSFEEKDLNKYFIKENKNTNYDLVNEIENINKKLFK